MVTPTKRLNYGSHVQAASKYVQCVLVQTRHTGNSLNFGSATVRFATQKWDSSLAIWWHKILNPDKNLQKVANKSVWMFLARFVNVHNQQYIDLSRLMVSDQRPMVHCLLLCTCCKPIVYDVTLCMCCGPMRLLFLFARNLVENNMCVDLYASEC